MKRFQSSIPLCLFLIALVSLFAMPDYALAGLGGTFVKTATKSTFMKVLLGGLFLVAAVVLLPLILYVVVSEHKASKRCKETLTEVSEEFPFFAWQGIHNRVEEIVKHLHSIWETGDLSSAESMMVPRYYASQPQMMEYWKDVGQKNILTLKKLKRIRPLLVHTGSVFERPHVMVQVDLKVIDYLMDAEGKVLHGSKEVDDASQLWRMEYYTGSWCLSSIETDDQSLNLALTDNSIDHDFLRTYLSNPSVVTESDAEYDDAEDSEEDIA